MQHTYSPVHLARKLSDSASSSTTDSSLNSPESDQGGDPFDLSFALTQVTLESNDQLQEYFPVSQPFFALPSLARTPKSGGGRVVTGGTDEDAGGWDLSTPRFEHPPSVHHNPRSLSQSPKTPSIPKTAAPPRQAGETDSSSFEFNPSALSSSPDVSTTPLDIPPPPPSSSSAAVTNPLPHLHLIPRPAPTLAQRKYSSSLLSATQRLLEISLSPNPSPSNLVESSYFPTSSSVTTNPLEYIQRASSHEHEDDGEESDWSPALSLSPHRGQGGRPDEEDGAFSLEDEGSYERRFVRLRREADARAEALRALREAAGGGGGEGEGSWADEDADEEWERGFGDGSRVPSALWDEEEEEGQHHVEYSGFP